MFFKKSTWYWEMCKREHNRMGGVFSGFFSDITQEVTLALKGVVETSATAVQSWVEQHSQIWWRSVLSGHLITRADMVGLPIFLDEINHASSFESLCCHQGPLPNCWYGILSFATFPWITSEKFCNLYLICLMQNRSKDLCFFRFIL